MPADRLRERGSAAVEFALLLPILLLLLLALVQVGVIARDSLVLTQASRAGARVQLDPFRQPRSHHTERHGAATPLRRLAIANHTNQLTSSKIPIASHGHGLHSSTQDWLVAVEVHTVPGPDRFVNAT